MLKRSQEDERILQRLEVRLAHDPAASRTLRELTETITDFAQVRERDVLQPLYRGEIAAARETFAGVQLVRHHRMRELAAPLEARERADANRSVAAADERTQLFIRLFTGAGAASAGATLLLGLFMRRTMGASGRLSRSWR